MATTVTDSGSGSGPAPSAQGVSSPAVASGIRRLRPVDGLFLRAEHLDQIQEHAADLGRLAAAAGGSGVVYGFTLDLDGERLGSTAGLAVDPAGRMLRSPHRMEVGLEDLGHDAGRVWVVEVVAAEPVLSGHEPLYSAVCAGPCTPGSTAHPWSESAVRLQVRSETLGVEADPDHLVSAVASAWFERERRGTGPWLTPTSPGGVVGHLADRPWSVASPSTAPGAAGVPLGLLIRVSDAWYLDTWAARRDRMVPPPSAAWQNRLGRRPEPVFTAQVLQFQDQLARGGVGSQHPLPDRFVELPPAGFLPMPDLSEDTSVEGWLDKVFDDSVDLRVYRCSADAASSAVELAAALDRTPLRPHGSEDPSVRPGLLVLVPTLPADLPALATDRYPWLAFTRMPRFVEARRGRRRPPPPGGGPSEPVDAQPVDTGPVDAQPVEAEPLEAEPVQVHVADAPWARADYLRVARTLATQEALAGVRFPRSGWQAELDPETVERVRSAVERGAGYTDVDLLVTTAVADREPLVTARARALAADLGLGAGRADRSVGIYSARFDGPDMVIFMVRRKR